MKRRERSYGGDVAVQLTSAGSVPIAAAREPDREGVRATVGLRVRDAGDGIVIQGPLGVSERALLEAARWAIKTVQRFEAERRDDLHERQALQGRTDMFDLHARLGSWDRAAEAVRDPATARDEGVGHGRHRRRLTEDEYELAVRAHAWAQSRVLGPRYGSRAEDDLGHLDSRTLRRWANEQLRYETLAEALGEPLEVALADSQAAASPLADSPE